MISINEFTQRRNENVLTLNYELANKCFTPSNYHFFEKDKDEEKRDFEFENGWDIMAATIAGDLPSNARHGEDGYRLDPNWINLLPSNHYIPMEYKISRKHQSSIWQTVGESLKTGTAHTDANRRSLRTSFVASYEIKNNLLSKNRLTVLFVYDETIQQFISGFELTGPQVINILNTGSKSSSRSIKLSRFINDGKEINLTVPSFGLYKDWEDHIRTKIITLKVGDVRPANTLLTA